VLHEEGDLG